eukprot:UN1080
MVAKDFKKRVKDDKLPGLYAHQMENSAVAAFLAKAYNKKAERDEGARRGPFLPWRRRARAKKIEFLRSYVIEVEGYYYSLEQPLPAGSKFTKYSSNSGWWNLDEFSAALADFCKWTLQATDGYLIVADLQGVELEDRFVLTDPAVLCEDTTRFGRTNLGVGFMERVLKGLNKAEECCGSS